MWPMKILIIEDEELAARKLRRLLLETYPDIEILGHLDSIEASVDWLKDNKHPDLILMDIELSDGQCFEIFFKVDLKCPVIFTTSYDEFAIQAFSVNSVAYLLKPIEQKDLVAAIRKYEALKDLFSTSSPGFSIEYLVKELQVRLEPRAYRKRFLAKYGNRITSFPVHEIAYFYTESKVSFLITFDGKRSSLDYNIEALEGMLDPDEYFRVSRSYIISMRAISKIDDYFGQRLVLQLNPTAREQVLVSRDRVSAFKNWLGK